MSEINMKALDKVFDTQEVQAYWWWNFISLKPYMKKENRQENESVTIVTEKIEFIKVKWMEHWTMYHKLYDSIDLKV